MLAPQCLQHSIQLCSGPCALPKPNTSSAIWLSLCSSVGMYRVSCFLSVKSPGTYLMQLLTLGASKLVAQHQAVLHANVNIINSVSSGSTYMSCGAWTDSLKVLSIPKRLESTIHQEVNNQRCNFCSTGHSGVWQI